MRALIFAVALLQAGAAWSQIYECLDAEGRREFAQKCSPGTVKQREVSKAGAGTLEGNVEPQRSYKDEEQAFRRRQLEREENEAKEAKAAANSLKKCESARSYLRSIESARRVTSGNDPKTGERRYLDDAERDAATQRARDGVAANCK
jgi:hypothetical protein